MSAAEIAAEEEVASDLSNPQVIDKYRSAATIVNTVLDAVVKAIAAGKTVVELCEFGDALIEGLAKKAYNKPDPRTGRAVDKGIAFPTCVSVNECAGNFSPLKTDAAAGAAAGGSAATGTGTGPVLDGAYALKAGDVVKVDLGAQIDGFIAVAATTVVVGEESAATTGPKAELLAAAYTAAEVALRSIKPGATNTSVTEAVGKVAAAFGVTPVQGVLMHNMRQGIIDGSKVIMLRGDDPEHKVDEAVFEPHEVYSIDILLSTGEGKPRELDARPTVFKLAPESSYAVKMKASKALVNDAARRFGYTPFTLRAFADDKDKRKASEAALGISECLKHGVVHAYPVLYEREGALVAHVKYTVLLMPGGTLKVAGMKAPAGLAPEKVAALPDDIKALLATEPYVAKKKAAAAKE